MIYRKRMELEAQAGNQPGIIAAYTELRTYLDDFDSQPSPVTAALYNTLVGPRQHT